MKKMLWLIMLVVLSSLVYAQSEEAGLYHYNLADYQNRWNAGILDMVLTGTPDVINDYPEFAVSGDAGPNCTNMTEANAGAVMNVTHNFAINSTVLLWVKFHTLTTGNERIWDYWLPSDNEVSMMMRAGPSLQLFIYEDVSFTNLWDLTGKNDGKWYMITLTRDSGNTYRFYENYTELTNFVNVNGPEDFNGTTCFGYYCDEPNTVNYYAQASFDNIMVLNRTLSPTEIQNVYETGYINGSPAAESNSSTLTSLTLRTVNNNVLIPGINISAYANGTFSNSIYNVSYEYRWFINSTAVTDTLYYNNSPSGEEVLIDVFPSINVTKNSLYTIKARSYLR